MPWSGLWRTPGAPRSLPPCAGRAARNGRSRSFGWLPAQVVMLAAIAAIVVRQRCLTPMESGLTWLTYGIHATTIGEIRDRMAEPARYPRDSGVVDAPGNLP